MKERFLGDGRPNLIEGLRRQPFAEGVAEIAEALASAGSVEEFTPGERLIAQGGEDNDVYLLLAGTVAVVINGQETRTLGAGQHAGEMAAVEPGQPRSASIIAEDTVVALKIGGSAFLRLGPASDPKRRIALGFAGKLPGGNLGGRGARTDARSPLKQDRRVPP